MEIMEVVPRVLQEQLQLDLIPVLELNAKVLHRKKLKAWLKLNKIMKEVLTRGSMTATLIEIHGL